MQDLNFITVKKTDIVMRHCANCGTKTAHIGKEDGTRNAPSLAGVSKQPFNTCLQCFVDVNSVNEWSRWIDEKGQAITAPKNPRGVRSK